MNKIKLKRAGVIIFWLLISIISILLVITLTIYFYPKTVKELQTSNLSSFTYEQSISSIKNEINKDKSNPQINKTCLPIIKTHDKKTDKAVVMMHGLSACPNQFRELADTFFNAGYNVYVPRAPWHGFTDSSSHDKITTKELADFLNHTASQSKNLGKNVGIVGLSGGATLATWLTQYTDVFSRALFLSPFYEPSIKQVPKWQIPILLSLYGRDVLPTEFRDNLSIRAVAKYMIVYSNYRQDNKTSLKHLAVVTSQRDDDIDLSLAHLIPRSIKKANKITYQETRLSKKIGVVHDLVNPNAPGLKNNKAQLYKLYLDMYENKPVAPKQKP